MASSNAGSGRHIVFIGGMGAGKTSSAAGLARRLDRPFLDNDTQLFADEQETGRDVARHRGVQSLHQAEAEHLRKALAIPEPAVIAAAASTVEDEKCTEALQRELVVWVRTGPETAEWRLARGSHRRDLGPDTSAALTALADRREGLYRQVADLVIDTDHLEPDEVVEQVLTWLDEEG